MVLPPSAADSDQDQADAAWLERLSTLIELAGERGTLVLVIAPADHRLKPLVEHLEAHGETVHITTEPRALADLPDHAVCIHRAGRRHADWLNANRPVFATRRLRTLIWADAPTAAVLGREAVDFFDWISHRVLCPPRAPQFVRTELASLPPDALGISWIGGSLRVALREWLPIARPRWLDAGRESLASYFEAFDDRDLGWVVVENLKYRSQLRNLRWALASTRGRVRAILSRPSFSTPGFHVLDARTLSLREALKDPGPDQPRPAIDAELRAAALAAPALALETWGANSEIEALLRSTETTSEDWGPQVSRLVYELDDSEFELIFERGLAPAVARSGNQPFTRLISAIAPGTSIEVRLKRLQALEAEAELAVRLHAALAQRLLLTSAGRLEEAVSVTERMRALSTDAADARLEASVLGGLAALQADLRDFEQARQTLADLEAIGEPGRRDRMRAHMVFGYNRFADGQLALALTEFLAALALSDEDVEARADALHWVAFSRWGLGEADAAFEAASRELELRRQLPTRNKLASALHIYGLASILVGDLARAHEALTELSSLSDHGRGDTVSTLGMLRLSRFLATAEGRHEDARVFDEKVDEALSSGEPLEELRGAD